MSGAAARRLPETVEYPDTDGKPMAESDVHRDEMVALIDGLKRRYADRDDVYVAGNLLVYYEDGNPKARFAPDTFVVFGVPKRKRRVYKLWDEKKAPSVAFEVTSKSTWLEDEGKKKALCARLGVAEYYLFDPLAEYLDPPLQGFRLEHGQYVPMRRGEGGSLESAALDVRLALEGHRLRLADRVTGDAILWPEEVEIARREAEKARDEAEAARREAEALTAIATVRAETAEAEIVQLRALLAQTRKT